MWIHTKTHIYYVFFIHSSVDGHSGRFYVLAIANNAAMNTGVHVSFWITVLRGYIYPGMELLGHTVAPFSVFWETSTVLPQCVFQFIFSSIVYESSPSSTFSPTFFFYDGHSDRYYQWGVISLWFWFTFPWWLAMLSIFSCACWSSACHLWKMSIHFFCPFFNWVVFVHSFLKNEVCSGIAEISRSTGKGFSHETHRLSSCLFKAYHKEIHFKVLPANLASILFFIWPVFFPSCLHISTYFVTALQLQEFG